MTVYLTRHASAGKRGTYLGDDLDRPLDSRGQEQARDIASRFANEQIDLVLSSPATRCVQTVEPLADKLGVKVEPDNSLLEGRSAAATVDRIRQLATDGVDAVLCSHGDIIPDAIEMLARDGMVIIGHRAWAKGSTWRLDVEDGIVASAHFLGPY